MRAFTLPFTAALLFAAGAASAETPFSHPAAVGTAATGAEQAQQASPTLIGHPASPTWVIVHSNEEHPAVRQMRLRAHPDIDPNTFIVQPPASVHWTLHSAEEVSLAKAGH